MTARDAGGIASRVLAVYMALMALQSLEFLLEVIRPGPENTLSGMYSPITVGLKTALLAFTSIMLWANAARFWPSDNELRSEPTMSSRAWLHIGLIFLGIYWLAMSVDVAIVALLKSTLQTTIEWPVYDPSIIFQACLNSVIGLALITIGWIGMRSQSTAQDS